MSLVPVARVSYCGYCKAEMLKTREVPVEWFCPRCHSSRGELDV